MFSMNRAVAMMRAVRIVGRMGAEVAGLVAPDRARGKPRGVTKG
jgi:hypothetical protein